MKKLAALLALSAALCGCCTVTLCRKGGRDMVEVTNSSLKLFGFVPIVSGDPEYPNRESGVWFCDSLLLDVNMMLLDDAMRKHGYRSFRDISSYKTHESCFLFILKRDVFHTSAELLR